MPIRKRVPVGEPVAAAVPPEATVAMTPPPADPVVVTGAPADPLLAPPVDPAVAAPPYAGPPYGPDAAVVPPGEDADNRFGMGMLIGLLVLLLVGGVIAAILLTRHHRSAASPTTTTVVVNRTTPTATTTVPAAPAASTVVVPSVLGQRGPAAASALRGQGFTVRTVTVRGPAPAGAVVAQNPAANSKAAASSVITLEVSNGAASAQPAPPSVSTVTVTAATPVKSTPAATTGTPATTTTAGSTSTEPASTSPAAPAKPAKPASATVPDVAGSEVQSAAASLAKAGFLVTVAYVPGTDPLGSILAESPDAGSTAPTTAHITINASSGPGDKQQETVPDASGKTIPDAVSAMQQAGLRLFFLKKTVTDRALAGKVVEQSPAPGRTAPRNAQVLVYMGAYRTNH